jgi:hypothetical protein
VASTGELRVHEGGLALARLGGEGALGDGVSIAADGTEIHGSVKERALQRRDSGVCAREVVSL